MKILADASLPNLPTLFAKPHILTTYDSKEQLHDLLGSHEILVCRSTLKVSAELLANTTIQCVATASSGVDHVDANYLNNHGITLFDAKGCNARSVADYVLATLAVLQKQNKLTGNQAGVIGLGEVGTRVVERLRALGLDVICFDPLKAELEDSKHYGTFNDLLSCDLLCIHANLHEDLPYPSKNLLDATFLTQLKPGVTIINAARGGIVDEQALLSNKTRITYCTDVYHNEPAIDARLVRYSTLCTPHIAGHSIDAKLAAVVQLSLQVNRHYQVAMPSLNSPMTAKHPLPQQSNWQDSILSLYDPRIETQLLKTAQDKKLAFIALRTAHKTRHDFIYYDASQLDQQTKLIMGQQ